MDRVAWFGFGAGILCVVLSAAMYRISWELPQPKPSQEELRQMVEKQTVAPPPVPAPPKSIPVPLERLDKPPRPASTPPNTPPPASSASPSPPAPSPDEFVIKRAVSPQNYAPGDMLTVSVEMEYPNKAGLSLLTLEEILPEGCVYLGADGELNADKAPVAGDKGKLLFIWNNPVNAPQGIQYRISTPGNAAQTTILRGQVSYQTGNKTMRTRPSAFVMRPARPQ